MKKMIDTVLNEIGAVLNSFDEKEVDKFCEFIVSHKNSRFLGYSAGRMGIGLRTFIMRLNHLGIDAHWYTDNSIPKFNKNDVFMCCSNSGETKTVRTILDIFKDKAGGFAVSVVGNDKSYIAENSDIVLKFKTVNGGMNSKDSENKMASIQPMTTACEQSMMIFFDIVVLKLMKMMNITVDDMKNKHTNIE